MRIICGTGHRPNKLGGYGQEATEKVVTTARIWLTNNKPDKVISGMALGWDTALAQAALSLEIPLVAAIPFLGQERMWPQASRDIFYKIAANAEEVVYVSEEGYAPWKMQVRNEWMVKNADTVLALWDGSEGGTGNCVAYAKKVNKPIINVWDLYQEIVHDRY